MNRNKWVLFIVVVGLIIMTSGCGKPLKEEDDLATTPSPAEAISEAPTVTPDVEPFTTPELVPTEVPTITPINTATNELNELSMEAYNGFLNNGTKLSFDRYMPSDYMEGDIFNKGSEYTLSEVLDTVKAYYFEHLPDKDIKGIDYSYIDCGKDGVSELAIRFNGMNLYYEDEDSTLVYIIKYIDGTLSLCYYYETWARSDSSIDIYGSYQSSGSGGASNHYSEYGLIDKEGNWQFIVGIESESDINQLNLYHKLGQIPELAASKGVSEGFEFITLHFDEGVVNTYEDDNYIYTFNVYDKNGDIIEDEGLYTNSIYKEIFDEAGILFITPDEVSIMIEEKGNKVGAIDVSNEETEVLWMPLINDIFSYNADKNVTYEKYARLHESMPEYRFVATGLVTGTDPWSFGYVMGLEVFDENNTRILTEDFSEHYEDKLVGYAVYNEMMDTMGLHVVDVNFDGYKDVIILNNFSGAHANTWYDCWLWDVNTSSFVASESFAQICNPALNPDKGCIYSAGGSGAAYWGGQIYQFIDGEFVVTNDLYTDWDGLVEKKLTDGIMEIVREVKYEEGSRIYESEQEYYKNDELWQLENPHWYWLGGHHADQWLD